MNRLKVGMVQQSCTDDIAANIAKLKENIRKAAAMGARLIVLQELHNSVYFCKHEDASLCDLAEPVPGPSTEIFGALAKELGVHRTTLNRLFLKEMNMTWPQGSELQSWDNVMTQLYNVTSIPYTILIDQNGTIVAQQLRGHELEEAVKEHLE